MGNEILYNSPALHALKRQQLVSLSKRYGLKASGKNEDMIGRLLDFGKSLGPDGLTMPSPAPAAVLDGHDQDGADTTPTTLRKRASDQWEVLSESGASLVSPKQPHGEEMVKSDSMRSWKSAENGADVDGVPKSDSASSLKALASSIKRSASKHLLSSRSTSHSSRMTANEFARPKSSPESTGDEQPAEELADTPPSPASTVGIPRRHSAISLLERPSTVRLVSPTPTPTSENDDSLPQFPLAKNIHSLKERRSLAPVRTAQGQSALGRKSMPALSSSTSASLSSIYPPLPAIPAHFKASIQEPQKIPVNDLPGAYPTPQQSIPATPKSPAFGSKDGPGISKAQFSSAAQAVLAEMNAKLPEGSRMMMGSELLRGKKAEVQRLVSIDSTIGEGGWGLGAGSLPSKADRYAHAHQKEFAKMRSISRSDIAAGLSSSTQHARETAPPSAVKRKHGSSLPSAPNGLPLIPPQEDGRDAKRTKMSIGPIGLVSAQKLRERRRNSLNKAKGAGLSSKFSFLRNLRKSPAKKPVRRPSTELSGDAARSSSGTLPRAPQIKRNGSTLRRLSKDLSSVVKPKAGAVVETSVPRPVSETAAAQGIAPKEAKDRNRSTSAQTILSVKTSHTSRSLSRGPLPDFGVEQSSGKTATSSRSASVNALGLPKKSSMSTSSRALQKKKSQADTLRDARQAPPPPAPSAATSRVVAKLANGNTPAAMPPPAIRSSASGSTSKRPSTLYQPTAASLARMQSTIKPSTSRPLPRPPTSSSIPTLQASGRPIPPVPAVQVRASVIESTPFGQGSSRGIFESSFDPNTAPPLPLRAPVHKPSASSLRGAVASPNAKTGMAGRTPMKARSFARDKASGLSGMKSKSDIRGEMEMRAKKAEIRAKQGRMAEERGLRAMLDSVGDGMDVE